MIKKKRVISAEVQAKGSAALAAWREEKALMTKKGGKFLAAWEEEQRLKKLQKQTTPMQAIKNFCNGCVGNIMSDITNCTAKQCSLFI